MKKLINKLHAWLQLVRFPNLVTVPGDPVAGFFVASLNGGRTGFMDVVPAIFCSVMFYMTGLIWNDLADYAEDSATRSERPLPSGRIKKGNALIASLVFASAGIFAVAMYAGRVSVVYAVILLVLIFAYNFITKRWRFPGSLNMGLCRGLSFLLGASVVGDVFKEKYVLIAALGVTLYIASVSFIASREMVRTRFRISRWMPALSILACCLVLFYYSLPFTLLSLVSFGMVLFLISLRGVMLRGAPEPLAIQNGIAGFLRYLLLIQAAFCALVPGAGIVVAVILLVLIPVNAVLAKVFYST